MTEISELDLLPMTCKLATLVALILAHVVLIAQAPGQQARIPIGPLLQKYQKPALEVFVLDPDHILLHINNKCPKGEKGRYYGCDMAYLMIDRTGKLLASLATDRNMELLIDGGLLIEEDGFLTVLDKTFSVVAKNRCDKPCRKFPADLHLAPDAIVGESYCYFPNQCQTQEQQNPLFAKAVEIGARNVLAVSPDEIWFMDKKSRVSYLTSDGVPKSIPGSMSSTFATECGFELYRLGKARILSECTKEIPIGSDDALPLRTDTTVYDVISHSIIARRTGSGYFLSLDGKILGRIDHNKFIELEGLP